MAFGLVGSVTIAGVASATSVTVDKPTGVQQGDIMFALVSRYETTNPSSVPTGWSSLGSFKYTYSWWLYYKVAGDKEPGSYTWEWSTSKKTAGQIGAYRGGFDTADPIDASSNLEYYVYDTIVRAGSITVPTTGSPLVIIAEAYRTSAVTFTGPGSPWSFAEDSDQGETDGDFWAAFYSQVWSGSGSTGNVDITQSVSSQYKHAFFIALTPETPVTVAEAGAQGLTLTVTVESNGTPVTMVATTAETGAEGSMVAVSAGCTATAELAEAGVDGLTCDVDTSKTLNVQAAAAGADGLVLLVAAAVTVDVTPAGAGAESPPWSAMTGPVIDVASASAGAQGLATEIQGGVNVTVLPGAVGADGLVLTVWAGTAGLRRTYPPMVRTYPPLCRAA
jgi:hypothetical protein